MVCVLAQCCSTLSRPRSVPRTGNCRLKRRGISQYYCTKPQTNKRFYFRWEHGGRFLRCVHLPLYSHAALCRPACFALSWMICSGNLDRRLRGLVMRGAVLHVIDCMLPPPLHKNAATAPANAPPCAASWLHAMFAREDEKGAEALAP